MRRALLIFASREGQTEKVATRLAEHLRLVQFDVLAVNAADRAATAHLDLEAFDLLIFGASMHAGGLEREMRQFIDAHRALIATRARSFFLVSLSAATRDPGMKARYLADARRKMAEQLAVAFDDVEMIAGALRYSKYSRPLKWLMRRIAAKSGEDTDTSRDYEYTDWRQVETYAQRLAALA